MQSAPCLTLQLQQGASGIAVIGILISDWVPHQTLPLVQLYTTSEQIGLRSSSISTAVCSQEQNGMARLDSEREEVDLGGAIDNEVHYSDRVCQRKHCTRQIVR